MLFIPKNKMAAAAIESQPIGRNPFVNPKTLKLGKVYDKARDAIMFPIGYQQDVPIGEMCNIGFGSQYGQLPMQFTNIASITPFQLDKFNKDKSTVAISVDDCLALDQLAMDLKDHLVQNFPEKTWDVRTPYYKSEIKVGWPQPYKGNEWQIRVTTNGSNGTVDEYIGKEEFNKRIGFNNLMPKSVDVKAKLWMRTEQKEDGNVVGIVGVYYQLNGLEY